MVISANYLEFYCHFNQAYFVYNRVPAKGCFGFSQ